MSYDFTNITSKFILAICEIFIHMKRQMLDTMRLAPYSYSRLTQDRHAEPVQIAT